jgi:YD repeat-containing protein
MGSVASGKADFVGLPVLFAVGLLWSLTLRRTRSLWFAVGLQAAFDFGATFLYSVPNLEFGFPLGYHLSQARLHGPVWLTGGTMGVEGSPLRFLTVGILVLLVNKLYPAKAKDAQGNNGVEVSAKLDVQAQPKKGYLRSRGRRDLVFVCVGLALASWPKIRQYLNADPVSQASDFENWQARPKLDPVAVQTPGRRIEPCLFIVPPGVSNQPVASGSVGECLMLVPGGTELDLYEVFLWSGNLIPIKTDLYVPDFMPLAFTRTHVVDSLARREHKYFRDVYEPHFYWDSQPPYKLLEWYLPDGIRVKYERNSPGAPDEHPIWSQVHYDTDALFPLFKGSRANWTGWAWDLSLQDGTTYLLNGERGSLAGIFDKAGNEIHIARKPNGDLTEITSPNGNWIRFSQENGLLSRAADSMGNAVNYIYDERHRLKRVTDSQGETTEYEYNLFNHIARMTDSRGSNRLEIGYEPHDRDDKVIQLSLPDGSKFIIDYFLDKETGAGHVDITDPKRKITRVTMNPKPGENGPFYTVETLARNHR